MKTWLKALLLSAAFSLLLILVLPSLLKVAINSTAQNLLTKFDIHSQGLNITHLSWQRLTLDQLSISLTQQNLVIELEQLDWHFSVFDLVDIQLGRINLDKLKIQQLAANKNSSSSEQQVDTLNSPKELDITLLNVKQLFSQLPLEQLHIKQFEFHSEHTSVNGDIVFDGSKISSQQIITSNKLNNKIRADFNLSQQGDFLLHINQVKQVQPIFLWQGSIADSPDNKQLSINSQQVADLQAWLTLLSKEQLPIKAQSAIQTLNLNLQLPKQLNLNNSQKIDWKKLIVNNSLQLEVDGLSVGEQVKNAQLSLNIDNFLEENKQQETEMVFRLDKLQHSANINLAAKQPLQAQHSLKLKQAISVNCSLLNLTCDWQGQLIQKFNALQKTKSSDQLKVSQTLNLQGDLSLAENNRLRINANTELAANLEQSLTLWPKVTAQINTALNFKMGQANQQEDWLLDIPQGISSHIHYQETSAGIISPFSVQLLKDFQLTQKNLSWQSNLVNFSSSKIHWQDNNDETKQLDLEKMQGHCQLNWPSLNYQLKKLESATPDFKQLPIDCQMTANNTASKWQKWPVPAAQLTVSLHSKLPEIDAEINITGLNEQLDLQINLQHNLNKNKGAAQLYLKDLAMDWSALGLSNMALLSQAQFLNGFISAQGWLHWQQYQPDLFDDTITAWQWQPDIMLRVDDFAGIYNSSTTWENMDILMSVRRPLHKDFQLDAQLATKTANMGIEVSNILARTSTTIPDSFDKALINIQEVHADVLGGSIIIPLLTFDTSKQHNNFLIKAKHLDLAEIAKLEPQAGVKAQGLLDGEIPVTLGPKINNSIISWQQDEDLWGDEPTAQNLSVESEAAQADPEVKSAASANIYPVIEKGRLYARAPGGIVEYKGQTSDSLQQSNPMVKLAMRALENYHYNKLQADINYQPDGALNLALKFQGKNPDFFDGQATHFNLSLDYNLLDLLESLRISQDIVEKVENKYQ